MKVVGFEHNGQLMIGAMLDDGSVEPLGPMEQFWSGPQASLPADRARKSLAPASQLRLRPTVPPWARVICIGLNYRQHALEANHPIPKVPVVFARWAKTLAVEGDPVPAIEDQFDWEGELGVVIGRRMFRVNAQRGLAGVFGYCAFNDLSGRAYQTQTSQFTMGKNSDASGPMSYVVPAESVGDPSAGLHQTTRVKGELRQDAYTSDMIFNVGEIIAHVSQVMTLDPGDLIITGTPSGVGFSTGTFLRPGDVVEVEIEKIGRVRSPIVAPAAPTADCHWEIGYLQPCSRDSLSRRTART